MIHVPKVICYGGAQGAEPATLVGPPRYRGGRPGHRREQGVRRGKGESESTY